MEGSCLNLPLWIQDPNWKERTKKLKLMPGYISQALSGHASQPPQKGISLSGLSLQVRQPGPVSYTGPASQTWQLVILTKGCSLTLHTSRPAHPHDIQTHSLGLRPTLFKAVLLLSPFLLQPSFTVEHGPLVFLPPSFPTDIKPQSTKAKRGLRDRPVHSLFP
jgi:hypothetical protein